MAAPGRLETMYHPLQEGQIRLMRIIHNDNPNIECELHTFPLSELPPYTALSYCWTNKVASDEIRLNGQLFRVRPNLYAYLRIMMEERQTCWIFIDALCINQQDVVERGHQVKLMGQIYQEAEEVVSWMGEPYDLAWSDDIRLKTTDSIWAYLQSLCDDEQAMSRFFAEEQRPDFDAFMYRLSDAFLNTNYWKRVWVVQEIALARDLVMRSDKLRIRSGSFRALVQHLNDDCGQGHLWDNSMAQAVLPFMLAHNPRPSRRPGHTASRILMIASRIMDIRSQIRGSGEEQSTFMTRTLECAAQECSEDFDKVFGLLGLVKSQLQPDYRMSRLELYLRVLVEGVVEQGRIRELEKLEDPSKINEVSQEPLFVIQLFSSLSLEPAHPVLRITTDTALQCCSERTANPIALPSGMASIIQVDDLFRYNEKIKYAHPWYLKRQLRLWRTSRRLRRCVRTQKTFTSPCDTADSRTYDEWVAFAAGIAHEVADKGEAILEQRLEAKKAECERQVSRLRDLAIHLNLQIIEAPFLDNLTQCMSTFNDVSSEHPPGSSNRATTCMLITKHMGQLLGHLIARENDWLMAEQQPMILRYLE